MKRNMFNVKLGKKKKKEKKEKKIRVFSMKNIVARMAIPGFIAKTGAIISRKVYSLASFAGDH